MSEVNNKLEGVAKDFGFLVPRDQFDACLVGWVDKFGSSKPVYSYNSVIETMSADYGSPETARDMFSHSVRNAGHRSPCFLFQGG
tara:strand:+ start:270 stop:524 length:255 start_codon:yes stop_codon:yes gene_type:complete